MVRLELARDRITETYGARVFAIVLERNGYAKTAFEIRQIGGGQFRARKPVRKAPPPPGLCPQPERGIYLRRFNRPYLYRVESISGRSASMPSSSNA